MSKKLKAYYEVRDVLQSFDLLQWRGNYPMSRTIRKVTGEDVNHTSVVVRIPWMEHVVFSIEALDDGLHLYPLSELLEAYDGSCFWSPLKIKYLEDRSGFEATKWLMLHLGRKYDWSGCASNWRDLLGLKPKQANSKELYCSESVFLAAKERIIREGDPTKTRCGAGLPHLKDVEIAPVPGQPVHDVIQMWEQAETKRLIG